MANYIWFIVHNVTIFIIRGKCIVGDRVKGLHNCPRVPLTCSGMTASIMLERLNPYDLILLNRCLM